MMDKRQGDSATTFRNPFDDFNANVLDPKLIMQYWYTPFGAGALKDFDERRFFSEKMPIVLQGARGSGKTTILKYFSFPVQQQRANQGSISLLQQIVNDGGVGFYFRCDDSFLAEFKNVFGITLEDRWTTCFEYFLELFLTKSILEMLSSLVGEITEVQQKTILRKFNSKFSDQVQFADLVDLAECVQKEIRYINTFKNESLFSNASFAPQHIWSLYDISGVLIPAISSSIPQMASINFLLLIDEFENLPADLQKIINTKIKFCPSFLSMRIGRRSENRNVVTTETVNKREYLRQKHDYRLIVLDSEPNEKTLRLYLRGIASKRLAAVQGIKLPEDIVQILGDKEDLDWECDAVANNKNLHLKYLLNANARIKAEPELLKQVIKIIQYPQNRIAEMLNALWVMRRAEDEDPIEIAQEAIAAMHAFFEKKEHPLAEKYGNDYTNKYRYALTVLICAAYHKDKMYYSFNTISYLSEGNARTFINLCQAIISDSLFYEQEKFVSTGRASPTSQCRAIKSYATEEFDSVCSIIQNGNSIRTLLMNLGNMFSEYHRDRLVRYPETNQFIYNSDELSPEVAEVLDIAICWALIRKKKKTQRLSAGIAKEGDLYTINKIFAPLFNISYRTRGGFNVALSGEEIGRMIRGQLKEKKLGQPLFQGKNSPTRKAEDIPPANQLTLFE